MSYFIISENSFKKDYKRCKKRNYSLPLLHEVMVILQEKGKLPARYKLHKLTGNYKGRFECHVKPDWLLIWRQDEAGKEIFLERTGTHSDLFQ